MYARPKRKIHCPTDLLVNPTKLKSKWAFRMTALLFYIPQKGLLP
jgi:hypothetical protein